MRVKHRYPNPHEASFNNVNGTIALATMTEQKGTLITILYILLRFAPLGLSFIVMDLSAYDSEGITQIADRFIRLAVVLALWTMTEGVFMIWIRARNASASSSSGYGVVSAIFALIVLAFLQAFRVQSSQGMFLALLTALALRGMSRAGWEQGRQHIAFLTSLAAHATLGCLSFMTIVDSLPWQGAVLAIGLGSMLGALDATWYGSSLNHNRKGWILPVYRVSLAFGPTVVGTLALMGFLPRIYLAIYALLLLGAPLARHSSAINAIPVDRLRSIIGMSIGFIVIMIVCRMYS